MPKYPVSRIRQLFRAHHRFFTATAVGAVLGLSLPGTWRAATRVIIGWDAGILLYLGLCWTMMAGATPEDMRWRAGLLEEDRWIRLGLLGLMIAASVVSLLAIGLLLAGIKDLPPEASRSPFHPGLGDDPAVVDLHAYDPGVAVRPPFLWRRGNPRRLVRG